MRKELERKKYKGSTWDPYHKRETMEEEIEKEREDLENHKSLEKLLQQQEALQTRIDAAEARRKEEQAKIDHLFAKNAGRVGESAAAAAAADGESS